MFIGIKFENENGRTWKEIYNWDQFVAVGA